MRIAVGIATAGRREIVAVELLELTRQTRLPDQVVICVAAESDVRREQFSKLTFPVSCVFAPRGSSSQRNGILRSLEEYDLAVFFDDDFLPATDFLEETERLFTSREDIVVARGTLIADGINGPGIALEEARGLLEASRPPPAEGVEDVYGAYGCNFGVRLAAVRQRRVRFDEELPLYGWQEDIDFSRQLAPFGAIVISNRLRGVHLGVKHGRTSGVKFGYSQIANPIYLIRKGTMSMRFGSRLMLRNVCANVLRSAWPEPWVDRLGRLRGNLLAFLDLLRGTLHPRRIMDLE